MIFTIGKVAEQIVRLGLENPYSVKKTSFSPDGSTIAVGRLNGEVSLHSAENGQRLNSSAPFNDWEIEALVFSADSQYIFVASNTGAGRGSLDRTTDKWNERLNTEPIKMLDAKYLRLVRTFDTQGQAIRSLDISPDGRYLFTGLSNGLIVVWNIASGAEAYRFQPFKNFVIVKLSPDGKKLAATDTGSTKLKNLGTQRCTVIHLNHEIPNLYFDRNI